MTTPIRHFDIDWSSWRAFGKERKISVINYIFTWKSAKNSLVRWLIAKTMCTRQSWPNKQKDTTVSGKKEKIDFSFASIGTLKNLKNVFKCAWNQHKCIAKCTNVTDLDVSSTKMWNKWVIYGKIEKLCRHGFPSWTLDDKNVRKNIKKWIIVNILCTNQLEMLHSTDVKYFSAVAVCKIGKT